MERINRSAECAALIETWLAAGQTSSIRKRLRDMGYGNTSINAGIKLVPGIISSEGDGGHGTRKWVQV